MIAQLAFLFVLGLQDPATAPDLQQKVSFTSGPARAEKLLPELSRALKMPLMTAGTTQNEVLVIRVKDVSAGELLKKIAHVASAEWAAEGGGFRLIRPAAIDQREAAEERLAREEQIRKDVARYGTALSIRAPLTEATAKALTADIQKLQHRPAEESEKEREIRFAAQYKSEAMLPVQRAFARLARLVNPKQLAALPPGRWVYASRPTKMQLPLPPQAAGVLPEFIREQSLLVRFLPKQEPAKEEGGDEEAPLAARGDVLPVIPQGSKLLLIATQRKDTPSLHLEVLGPDGQIIDSTGGMSPYEPRGVETAEEEAFGNPLPKGEAPLPVPEDLLEMQKLFLEQNYVASEDLRRRFLKPAVYDPVAFSVAGLLPSYGTVRGVNVVARVSDDLFVQGWSKAAPSPSQLKERFEATDLLWSEADGWALIKPKQPHAARSSQQDRKLLEHAIGIYAERRALTIDEMAANWPVLDEIGSFSFWLGYCYVVDRNAALMMVCPDQDALRLYASFTPGQREAFWSQGGLALYDLLSNQRALVEHIVFRMLGSEQWASSDSEAQAEAVTTPPQMVISEITERYPYGLPPDVRLKGELEAKTMYLAQPKDPTKLSYSMNAAMLASHLLRQERNASAPVFDKFTSILEVSGELRLDAGNKPLRSFAFMYPQIDKKARVLSFKELPADFRAEVEKVMEKQREARKNSPPPNQQKPPPRPTGI
jgi:hypothetical protein